MQFHDTVPLAVLRDIAAGQDLPLIVKGNCMSPWMRDGQRIRVRPSRWYWPGDVLAVRAHAGHWISHRLIGYRPGNRTLLFLTQGDDARRPDTPVERNRIIGRVVGGECAGQACSPPLAHRLFALRRFLQLCLRAVGYRLRKDRR